LSTQSYKTARFGEIEVEPNAILEFPAGLPAFPEMKRFTMLALNADSPFQWLQSLDDPDLAFALIEPQNHFPDYHVQIKREELAALEFGKEDKLMIYVIITLDDDPAATTVNLKAPLLINARNLLGRQIVLKDGLLPVTRPIL